MFAAPVHRLSIVTSRFLYLVAVTGVQALVILVAAYVMGVRYAGGLAGIAACPAIGALFGAGVTSLSVVLAFSLRSHAQFFPITGLLGLPLTFASTALVRACRRRTAPWSPPGIPLRSLLLTIGPAFINPGYRPAKG